MHTDPSLAAFALGLLGRPLAMTPEAATVAYQTLYAAAAAPAKSRDNASAPARAKLYEIADGVAVIPFHGQAVNRASGISEWLGFAAYDKLEAALSAAAADKAVRGVILDLDSPGGVVAGSVEAAAAVRKFSASKPIVAHVDALAGSAAYVIAAGASRIVVTPSAVVGSIGVLVMHLDQSGALAARGVKPTLVYAGDRKADGSPYGPLAGEARKQLQRHVEAAHDLLVESVGRHRPDLGAAGARRTEAAIFMGVDAIKAGLADAVGGRDLARAFLFPPSSIASRSPAAARPAPVSSLPGAKPMSSPALAGSPSPVAAAPYLYSPEAMIKAASREQRRAAANALFAQQAGGASAEDFWRSTLPAKAGATAAAPAPTAHAPQGADDTWREVGAKVSRNRALAEVYR